MVYITTRQRPVYKQMSIEDLLFGPAEVSEPDIHRCPSNTRTYAVEVVSERIIGSVDVGALIARLAEFNREHKTLRDKPRSALYSEFYIPKKSGGIRKIDSPCEELKDALYELKDIFEKDFHALYHTAAFAYIKKRSTRHAVQRHQQNESKWFGKLDLSNFFGSTTIDFVLQQLSMIFPFSEIVKNEYGREQLYQAIELAFLDGGLPQGTPFSPLVTNVMMIPIDFALSKQFRSLPDKDGKFQKLVYTRYADDFILSSKYEFDIALVERTICDVLTSFNAPFSINTKKTRYGNSNGRNWNLGLMLNKDNEITVGHRNKKAFQSMLRAYILDRRGGKPWPLHDVQVLSGLYSYYRSVEQKSIDAIIRHTNDKFDSDVVTWMRDDVRNLIA